MNKYIIGLQLKRRLNKTWREFRRKRNLDIDYRTAGELVKLKCKKQMTIVNQLIEKFGEPNVLGCWDFIKESDQKLLNHASIEIKANDLEINVNNNIVFINKYKAGMAEIQKMLEGFKQVHHT